MCHVPFFSSSFRSSTAILAASLALTAGCESTPFGDDAGTDATQRSGDRDASRQAAAPPPAPDVSGAPTAEAQTDTPETETDTETETEFDTGGPVESCTTNSVEVRDDSGETVATLEGFVFVDDTAEIWILGFETRGEGDPCTWASDPTTATGWQLGVELGGSRDTPITKQWTSDADGVDGAEVELFDDAAGTSESAADESGTLTLESYTPGDTLRITGMSGTFPDGSTLGGEHFTACYCASVPTP